jgi:hypothetical protein
VKLTALRAAAFAQNVRLSKHDASGLAQRLDQRRRGYRSQSGLYMSERWAG